MVVVLLLSAPLSQAGLLGAGDHNTVYTRDWYGVCCRHGRGQLQGAALQSGDRGLARGLPGLRPLLLGVRILPRPGQVTWTHVTTRDTRDTRATCRRWSQGEFRDCSGESNGSPLPLSVLTLEYLETLAGRPAAEDSLLLGR